MLDMNVQEWMNANPWVLFFAPVFVVLVICAVFLTISRLGGWALLGRRFRATEPCHGESWSWQSGQFRGWCNYNHCLTVGVNPEALYLSVQIPFRLFHPALLIPWREIEVETGKAFFGLYDTARFRMGTGERVTLRIYGKLVERVRQAAGVGWPLYNIEQMEARTRK
jgi:hypothetical protein